MAPVPAYQTRHAGSDALRTHRHAGAYAALVLDGSHIESSADGPHHCIPGSLLVHPRFHAHGNRFGRQGAMVANLDLPGDQAPPAGDALLALQVPDLREARAVFAHGDLAALRQLVRASRPIPGHAGGWQAALVRALRDGDDPVGRIAARLGVSAAHASRAIRESFGMGPQALRRELRWRRALQLMSSTQSLADVAAEAGFVDQSHLHRVTRACTGLTPTQLRTEVKPVQDARPDGMAKSV